jgi:hypothetical protein
MRGRASYSKFARLHIAGKLAHQLEMILINSNNFRSSWTTVKFEGKIRASGYFEGGNNGEYQHVIGTYEETKENHVGSLRIADNTAKVLTGDFQNKNRDSSHENSKLGMT